MLEHEDRLLGTCLIGTNLSIVTATTVFAVMLGEIGVEEFPWSLLLVPVALVFGEALPKTVMQRHATALAP